MSINKKTLLLYFLMFVAFVTIININGQRQIHLMQLQDSSIVGVNDSLLKGDIDLYAFMRDRKFINFDSEERKKFRYVYKFFEIQPYLFAQKYLLIQLHKYIFILNHSIVLFLIYLISLLLFYSVYNKNKNIVIDVIVSLFVLLLVSYLFATTNILGDERFTLVETLAISLTLYASIERKIVLFVFALLLGISNRESAMVLGLFYPLLNYNRLTNLKVFILLSIGPFFFISINFDILQTITLDLLLFHDEVKSLTIIKTFSHLIKYIIFLAPLIFLLYILQKNDIFFKKILFLMLIYVFIVLFGSFLGNTLLLFFFIPFYILAIAMFLNSNVELFSND